MTHLVTNQPPPLAGYDAADDPALIAALDRDGAGWAEPEVRRLAGSAEAQEWGRLANEHPPVLRTHDRYGHRIDEVELHPAWHELMQIAVTGGLSCLLVRFAPAAEADAFTASRLAGDRGRAYGTLPPSARLGEILEYSAGPER